MVVQDAVVVNAVAIHATNAVAIHVINAHAIIHVLVHAVHAVSEDSVMVDLVVMALLSVDAVAIHAVVMVYGNFKFLFSLYNSVSSHIMSLNF